MRQLVESKVVGLGRPHASDAPQSNVARRFCAGYSGALELWLALCLAATASVAFAQPAESTTSGKIDYSECFQCLDCQVEYFDDARCPPLARERKLSAAATA